MNAPTLSSEVSLEFHAGQEARKAKIREPHMTSVDLMCQVEYHYTPGEHGTPDKPAIDASAEVLTVRMWGVTAAGNRVLMAVELPREVVRNIENEVLHG